MLGLLQLLWLLSAEDALPGWCVINQCWREKRGSESDAFPLAIVSINFTGVAFNAFSRGKLAAQVEKAHSSGAALPILQVCPLLLFSERIVWGIFRLTLILACLFPIAEHQHFLRRLLSLHGFNVLQAAADHRPLF
jgi:hypothetical protein